MGKVVIVAGDVGTGKSYSLRNIPHDQHFVINPLQKDLPWEGSGSQYSKDQKNMAPEEDWKTILGIISMVNEKRTEIKYLTIDDIGFVMTGEYFAKADETGYTKFTKIGQHMQAIISAAKNARPDLHVALLFHDELESDRADKRKIKTIGKLLEDKYNPLGIVSVALFTDVQFGSDGTTSYKFVTNRTPIHPAKSPPGMFKELYIDNDMKAVFDRMDTYYNKKT